MERLRSIGEGTLGGLLVVGILAVQFTMLAGFLGGLAYKQECVTDKGTVKSDWTFQWAAPIPYVFRPSDPGCITHTASRVALNAVGIAGYEKTTPTLVATKFAEDTTDADAAYFVQLREATSEYMKRNESADTITAGESSVRTYLAVLDKLTPPARYGKAHAELTGALQRSQSLTPKLRDAINRRDRAGLSRMEPLLRREATNAARALQELNRLRAAE